MKIGQTEIEHQSSIINSMINDLARRYFIYSKLNPDTDTTTHDVLGSLAKDAGYLVAVNTNVIKIFKQENRINSLEDKMKNIPINTTMFESSPLEEYR